MVMPGLISLRILTTSIFDRGIASGLGISLALIPFTVMACAAAPQAPQATVVSQPNVKTKPSAHIPDASAAYHFMLGYQAESSQDIDRAIQEYLTVLRTDPAAQSVKARLADLYFSLGDFPNAQRYANEAAEGTGQDAQLLTQVAKILVGVGQGDRAVTLLDRAIEQDPTSSEIYFAKGLLLLNLKRLPEAEQAIRAGLARNPESPVGQYHLGRILLEAGKLGEAIASFERAIAINQSFEPAYLALASLYEARQEKDKAAGILQRYLRNVNPRNRDIRHHLVRLYVAVKDYRGATKELDELLAEDPTDLDAYLRLALIEGEQKDYAGAIERLTVVLKARPAELKVRDYLGYLYEEAKQPQKALEAYTFNVQLEPSYFEGHLHLGVLFYRLKRFPDAVTHLAEASKLNPKQPESHIVLGLAYLQMEQYEKAAQVFEEGIRQNPKSADLYFNLGTAYDKLNRFDEVVRVMEIALQLDPHHADTLNYLGYSYAERGIKIDQALSLTKQAVALKPDNGYYVDSLGWAFFKSGLLTEALTEIKRAVALVGDDPVIFEHLGDIYAKQQKLSEAREAWLHSLELDPSNSKLIERFRDLGMGDPTQEERIQQAKRRVSERIQSQPSTQ
jgi:tetratricopeptide (TPR) repeat protein